MKCNYTIKHYEECLRLGLEEGYHFMTMNEVAEIVNKGERLPYNKIICLRHDMDRYNSIKHAQNMMSVEEELRIKANYFVRLHSIANPMSFDNYPIIKRMINNHELGLHYDIDFAKLMKEDMMSFLQRDIRILENIGNYKVKGLSYHEPANCGYPLTHQDVLSLGLNYEAYNYIFFNKLFKYISDGRWREGSMCEWIKKGEPFLIINTHTNWWFKNSPLENY